MDNNRIQYYIRKGEGMNGIKSHRVRALQEMLFYLGYLNSAPDGQFGDNTLMAVKSGQSDLGFEINGIVDVSFFNALAAEVIYKDPDNKK